MSKASTSKAPEGSSLAPEQVQQQYNRYKNDLQALATKIGELEGDVEEHELVLKTLTPILPNHPDRKAFRLIGGILVERTVKDVEPDLRRVVEGIRTALEALIRQYKSKETEFQAFQKKYNIQIVQRQ